MTKPTKRARRRRSRAGFTLLELMVALAIGTLVIATVYTLGGASARAFQEQQRISQLQLATRLAMDRMRRDVALAAYGGTPNFARERICGGIASPGPLVGLQVVSADAEGVAALGTMPGAARAAPLRTDRVRIIGNLATADSYLIANTAVANGSAVLLQSSWQGFRRSFASDPLGMTFDNVAFTEVFRVGRYVHIEHPLGYHFVTQITSASLDSSGRTPRIGVNPPLPSAAQCNFQLCVGCVINPLVAVDYLITSAPPALAPRDPQVTGANTVLVRREVDPFTGAMIQQRVVLEYAVDLTASVALDTAAVGAVPDIRWQPPGTVIPAGNAGRIRGVRLSLSARSPEVDTAFEGPIRTTAGTLTGFAPFALPRPGLSRVRTTMADILLPNYAARQM